MIPVKLTLSGIYSYKEEKQTIDFRKLTSENIFGIFGKVGSGKSTILEAIIYALYGNAERIGKNDVKYNIMNLSSNKLYIEFEFIAGENNNEYLITVEYSRKKNNFTETDATKRKVYIKENDKWLELDSKDEKNSTENIIGLSLENFRRVIIIPQGKFQDFIQLKSKERTTMLAEIFPELKQYNLFDKTKKLIGETLSAIGNIDGQLKQLSDISEEALNAEIASQKTIAEQIKKTALLIKEKEEKANSMNKLQKLIQELNEKISKLELLALEEKNIDRKAVLIKQYTECLQLFSKIIAQKNERENELRKVCEALEDTEKKLLLKTKYAEDISVKFEECKKEFSKTETYKKEIDSLTQIIKLKEIDREISSLQQKKKTEEEKLKTEENRKIEIEKNIKQLNSKLDELKLSTLSTDEIVKLSNWYSKYERLQNNLNELLKKKGELANSEKELYSMINKLITEKEYLQNCTPNLEIIHSLTLKEIERLGETAKQQEEVINRLRVQQKLHQYSSNLQDGMPCPLCGSIHHPSPIEDKSFGTEIREATEKLDKINEEKNNLVIKGLSWLEHKKEEQKKNNVELNNIEQGIATCNAEINEHIKVFCWENFSYPNPEWEKTVNTESEKRKNIEALQEKIGKEERYINEIHSSKEKISASIYEISATIENKQGLVEQIKTNINKKFLEMYESTSATEITTRVKNIEQHITNTEQKYQQLEKEKNKATEEKNTIEGTLIQLKEQQKASQKAQEEIADDLKIKIEQSVYNSIGEITDILNQKIDCEKLQQEISSFREIKASLANRMQELKTEIGSQTYNTEEHNEIIEYLKSLTEENSLLIKTEGVCNAKIKMLTEKLAIKKDLERQFDNLTLRKTNLDTIQKLFTASGFMNFVSTMYLENLVKSANQRFREMTSQQLELILNAENEFEIRDYLNGGNTRSVKTLSGGQTFQASLSLALSLIDNVQCFANDSKKFFFIDEGFGSQDKDSLQVIFDTLKSLRKENRVVGIISHVEELKQSIAAHVSIENSSEYGSRIIMNK